MEADHEGLKWMSLGSSSTNWTANFRSPLPQLSLGQDGAKTGITMLYFILWGRMTKSGTGEVWDGS